MQQSRDPIGRIPMFLAAGSALFVFLPVLGAEFVNWDDDRLLLGFDAYRGLGLEHLFWMLTTMHMGHWMPLAWLSFAADHALWGLNPAGFHLTSWLLHGVNAGVLFLVARRLLRLCLGDSVRFGATDVGAFGAALVFAIHPLRAESVAWVTERRGLLCGLFVLLAVLAYLIANDARTAPDRAARWKDAVLVFGLAAVLSKGLAVALPLVLAVLDVYPLRRLGGATGWTGSGARPVWREKIPLVVVASVAVALSIIAARSVRGHAELAILGIPDRLLIMGHSVIFPLWKTAWPVALSPLYELPEVLTTVRPRLAIGSIAAAAITAFAVAGCRRWPALLAVWGVHVAFIVPVSGLFQTGPQLTADRYSYLPSLGWAILMGGMVARFWAEATTPWLRALAYFGDHEHPDRFIVNTPIGRS